AKKVAPAKKAEPRSLVVLEDETPWTAAELKAIRAEIEAHIAELQSEIDQAESEIVDLMRDSGDGAGDDQADAGAKTYEREQELALADNAREVLRQNEHALERIADGTYGVCESCGKPVGKLRLQAFPRATLCMPCKTKQERR
ncbi:TraR/DksA family transcriptional regulator, partial [Phycicoccus elongatus]